ncbi:hypothetical protein D047_4121A, partial [Vibrio parahaemolyticus VPTS-2010_2]
MSFFDTFHLKI